MPTTVMNVTGGSFVDNDLKEILRLTPQTTNATPLIYEFVVTDPPLGAIPQAFFIRARWSALGPASVSCGESSGFFYDNGAVCVLVGSAAPLAAGSATCAVAATGGGRQGQFTFTGLAATNLQWMILFEIVPLAAE